MRLSSVIARNAGPMLLAGAAGAVGAVLAHRRFELRRQSALPAPPPVRPLPKPAAAAPAPPVAATTPKPPPVAVPAPPVAATPPPAAKPPAPDLAGAVRAAISGGSAAEIVVEAAGSRVVLRGRVDSSEEIRELERRAAEVPGVEGVRVLLHLSGGAVSASRRRR